MDDPTVNTLYWFFICKISSLSSEWILLQKSSDFMLLLNILLVSSINGKMECSPVILKYVLSFKLKFPWWENFIIFSMNFTVLFSPFPRLIQFGNIPIHFNKLSTIECIFSNTLGLSANHLERAGHCFKEISQTFSPSTKDSNQNRKK